MMHEAPDARVGREMQARVQPLDLLGMYVSAARVSTNVDQNER